MTIGIGGGSTYLDTITDTVTGQFLDAHNYANSAWDYAKQYLASLETLIKNFTPDFIDLDYDIEPITTDPYAPDRPTSYDEYVKEFIEDDVDAGGTGLSTTVEQAIYDRDEARRELIDEARYQEALEGFSSLGWNIPPGALEGRLAEDRLEKTRADAEFSRDVMIKQAELAQANDHFIKQLAVEFHKGKIQLYSADVSWSSAQVDAAIKSYDVQQQHETNKVTLMLKEAEVNLMVLMENYKVQGEAIRAGANIYAQLAASALSSVSASAGLRYSGGYNHNYSESTSRSYSESHVYHYDV